ncbi:AbrB/MazE/SpoVT family DNA-binding domain-containing protein [Halorubrum amylolyticum]|uniref:AbrB/MazE/SpoVT family DNA-binding domain-containing protein n=1 Tax=Halorubrum amylolyticum TaxID=2508724 RepID=UPI001008EE09|nr:AbrB/MazE/SpoVT family DNA-binding domain-containing protein [Halorubrum amylolyticum]
METRKLQEVGGSTFTVSIPKEWATDHGFEVGMELQLYTHRDGSILVRSSETDVGRLEEATVDVTDSGPAAVRHAVETAHGVGFETITLRKATAFTDAERRAVRSTTRELVGTNVLSESPAAITVRHLLDTSSVSVRQSLVQLRYVVVSLLRDSVEAFADGADARKRIDDRAGEARRSADMITRHFSRSLVSYAELDSLDISRAELFAYYATASRLDGIVDQALRIADITERAPDTLPGGTLETVRAVADDVAGAVDDGVTAVLNGDATEAQRAKRRCDDAAERIEAVEEELFDGSGTESVPAAVALSSALDALRVTATRGRRVADIALRTAIRAENVDR